MLNTLMQSLPFFLGGLAVASAVGLLAKSILDRVSERWLGVFQFIAPLTAFAALCLCLLYPVALMGLGVLLVVCVVGAVAERATHPAITIERGRETVCRYLHYSIFSAALTFIFVLVFMLVSAFIFYSLYFLVFSPGVYWGLIIGGFFSPTGVAVIRWMLHTSQLRPGIDRHFREGEDLN